MTFLFSSYFCSSQIAKDSVVTQDTLVIKPASFQKKMEENKDKNKFNKLVYKLFFKNSSSKEASKKIIALNRFKDFEGKIIRNIHITTLDPFGYSIADSTKKPEKFIEKAGNSLHVKTKNFTIKNYLLQKQGETLDSLKILESERLIRSQRFTRRVVVQMETVGKDSDSVDLYVYTLDSWSIIPTVNYSNSKLGIELRDRNFMGWGHDFSNYYRQNFENGKYVFRTNYTIQNIQRTFINFNIGYHSNEENEYSKSVSLSREFYSPLTRWAGGAYVGQRAHQDSIPNTDGIVAQNFKYNLQDYWGGFSINLSKRETTLAKRLNNLVISARYFNVHYVEEPIAELDPIDFYSNEEFYLFGLGVSQKGYVQDRFIKNYDIVEDIPIGMAYGINTGFQRKYGECRYYLAGKFKYGNYFKPGYFSFGVEYGSFFTGGKTEQSAFSLKLLYYTHLKSWGQWKFRTFVSNDLILGNNRKDSRGDRLTLNENDPSGIEGFYSLDVLGTKKWLTNIQIQSYSPHQFLGFRLSPFLNSSLGLISDDKENLFKGKLYSKIGIGIMFTNDYLIFSNFTLSLAWYNSIPGQGNNIFKANAVGNRYFQLMDFDFGKPELVEYNPNIVN